MNKKLLTVAQTIDGIAKFSVLLCVFLRLIIVNTMDIKINEVSSYKMWDFITLFLFSRYACYGALYASVSLKLVRKQFWKRYIPLMMYNSLIVSILWFVNSIFSGLAVFWGTSGLALFISKHWENIFLE